MRLTGDMPLARFPRASGDSPFGQGAFRLIGGFPRASGDSPGGGGEPTGEGWPVPPRERG